MYASIFIPHFQVQSLVRSEPELSGQALAVVDGVPPMLKVVGANKAAFQAGVELGMAKLKVEHFFNVTIRQRSTVQERFRTRRNAGLRECIFTTSGEHGRRYGRARSGRVASTDRIVFADCHPDLRSDDPDRPESQCRRRRQSGHRNPCGPGICRNHCGSKAARSENGWPELPLEVLLPEPEFLETLHRWGIRTFGAFAKIPATQISERFGQDGVRLHKLARAAGTRPLNPYKESLRFEEMMELGHAIAHLEPLTFVLSRLLDQICRRLRIRNRSTHEVRVKLDLDERGALPHERVLQLPLPVGDSKLLVKLLMLDLESHPPKAAVVGVSVEAIPTRPRTIQNGLFVTLAPEPEKLELTLARIAHVVGKENVGSPEVSDTYRPDAFRVNRFFPEGARKDLPGLRPPLLKGGDFRKMTLAFRQFRPAREATVQLRNGAPTWIAFHGLIGSIPSASGPWNSSGEWWREDRWDREEWDVGIESSAKGFGMYRIYRDCASNRWFAEGIYD